MKRGDEILRGRARAAVMNAVRSGRMQPALGMQCVDCGEMATGYDHRDYRKPLDVQPVCRYCNTKRGPGLPYTETKHRAAPERTPDQKEFRAECDKLRRRGYSSSEISEALSISIEMLNSMLYRKMHSIPDKHIKKLRSML